MLRCFEVMDGSDTEAMAPESTGVCEPVVNTEHTADAEQAENDEASTQQAKEASVAGESGGEEACEKDREGDSSTGQFAAARKVDRGGLRAPVSDHEDSPEGVGNGGVSNSAGPKPSYTLHIKNLAEDVEVDELSMRLERFGTVVSIEKGAEITVAKFLRTKDAYEARTKLNGSVIEGKTLEVEFGPQDPEHYNRGKKRTQGEKTDLDGTAMGSEGDAQEDKASLDGEADKENQEKQENREHAEDKVLDDGLAKKLKTEGDAEGGGCESSKPTYDLVRPPNPVSKWAEDLKFETQLEDYMKMQRRGMYNRYLVLGKLPPHLRTEMAIWHLAAPVQRDMLQVEMLTCFGKPVAHIALRSATAAATLHRITEQLHQGLTVAFAPPRKASRTLWLGNVDDFVPRKELEALLQEYGKLVGGLRYVPARTCAFVTFEEMSAAVAARNAVYALEVQRVQYLNVDFVEEGLERGAGPEGTEAWGVPMVSAWGGARGPGPPPPPPPPWGPHAPWIHSGKGGWDGPWRGGKGGWAPKPSDRGRAYDRNDRGDRGRSRSRSRGRRRDARSRSRSPGPGNAAKVELGVRSQERVKLFKMGEFCCNIVANFVRGNSQSEPVVEKLQIDQRTKIDHCRSHMDKAGQLSAIWHFSAADRKDCAAYDALCDYFVEKERVGLVQTPSYYVYIVPPTEKYLKELKLPVSNYVVGIQIPVKK